jgi:hypothetical protein
MFRIVDPEQGEVDGTQSLYVVTPAIIGQSDANVYSPLALQSAEIGGEGV